LVQGFEKRTCHRFEIPGSFLMYKRIGLIRAKKYIEAARLYNISKGGLSFACDEEIKKGKNIIVKIIIPDQNDLELLAQVCWQRESRDQINLATGIAFSTFGSGSGRNPMESLDRLRELDKQFVKER
jgi:Tfp pilus assembly protein PilZ